MMSLRCVVLSHCVILFEEKRRHKGRLAVSITKNHSSVMNITSTFIECRGEPELIFVQFDNSIIKLIIKHQQYQATRRYRLISLCMFILL